MKSTPFLALLLTLACLNMNAQNTPGTDNGDAQWEKVTDLLAKPGEFFQSQRPASREEFQAVVTQFEEMSVAAANACQDFIAKFPASRHLQDARMAELEMLASIVRFGGSKQTAERLNKAEDVLLADAAAPKDMKYMVEMRRAMEVIEKASNEGGDLIAISEATLQPILERYPEHGETYGLMLNAADGAPADKAIALVKKLLANDKVPEDVKSSASGKLAQLEAVGQPMPLKFKALDGREVDLSLMTNKVVLVDFWATWCGPCVREMPRMKKLYDENHAKGFEIVGVSLDQDQAKLEDFVKAKGILWPQAFDGKGWQSDLARQFGVNSIPAMWLVNKRGKVVSTDARETIEKDLPALLAE